MRKSGSCMVLQTEGTQRVKSNIQRISLHKSVVVFLYNQRRFTFIDTVVLIIF